MTIGLFFIASAWVVCVMAIMLAVLLAIAVLGVAVPRPRDPYATEFGDMPAVPSASVRSPYQGGGVSQGVAAISLNERVRS